MKNAVCKTDQTLCYDIKGKIIPCANTGQDGDLQFGVSWPEPRFKEHVETVVDKLTGLIWTKDANLAEFPLMWQEAMNFVKEMNMSQTYGCKDWRLPNRKELFSLISHTNINPALPNNHPFVNIFSGYYWTSTSCSRLQSQAWYIHFGGARVFKGMKYASYIVWPVRGCQGALQLPCSGQRTFFNKAVKEDSCGDTMQDGVLQIGEIWPETRFICQEETVVDSPTGLIWMKNANHFRRSVNWQEALDYVKLMNRTKAYGYDDWRLPNVRELESLTDMGSHTPALTTGHPFKNVEDWYWSSSTSTYNPEYAWVLYMEDGAIGVGYKGGTDFYVWPVRGGTGQLSPHSSRTFSASSL